MKNLFLAILLLQPVASMQAATTVSGSWSVFTAIPDYDDPGFTSTQTLMASGITNIQSVQVTLDLTGGWNGDLFAYLAHDGVISILLNRAGRSLANPDGAGSSGMTVTFSDAATLDIHTAIPNTGVATGLFQPDGRNIDPLFVENTDLRTAPLSVFNTHSAAGNWTLFMADQASGEVSTLQSWSLSVTGVPEPSSALLAALAAGVVAVRRNRFR